MGLISHISWLIRTHLPNHTRVDPLPLGVGFLRLSFIFVGSLCLWWHKNIVFRGGNESRAGTLGFLGWNNFQTWVSHSHSHRSFFFCIRFIYESCMSEQEQIVNARWVVRNGCRGQQGFLGWNNLDSWVWGWDWFLNLLRQSNNMNILTQSLKLHWKLNLIIKFTLKNSNICKQGQIGKGRVVIIMIMTYFLKRPTKWSRRRSGLQIPHRHCLFLHGSLSCWIPMR